MRIYLAAVIALAACKGKASDHTAAATDARPATPRPPPPKPTGLVDLAPAVRMEGVWRADDRALVFDPRGYAHRNVPRDALDLDFDALGKQDARFVEIYEIADGQLTMRMRVDGVGNSQPFERVDDRRFELGGLVYDRVDGVTPDGLRLEAHLHSDKVDRKTRGYDGTSVVASTDYYLTSEGRFSYDSAFSGGPRTRGSYAIAHDSITLTFDDGRVASHPFYPVHGDVKSGAWFLGGLTMHQN